MHILNRTVETRFIVQNTDACEDIRLEAYPIEQGIVILLGKIMSNGQYETLLDIILDRPAAADLAANLKRWSKFRQQQELTVHRTKEVK